MKIGRNDPCPCGSGKKYKKCCMNTEGVEPQTDKSPLGTINTLMQKGYEYAQKDQMKDACDQWWQVWKETLVWLDSKQVTAIEDLDSLTGETVVQYYSNWVQDFEMGLEQVCSTDERYMQMRFDFTTQFRDRFPDSDSLIMLNMGTAAGEALFHLGKKEEADTQFEKVVREHPNNPWALIRWGDMYTPWINKANVDYSRACELYEQALKVATDPDDQQSIQDRIKDLK